MSLPTTPALTTNCIVFNAKGQLLLVKRTNDPSKAHTRCLVVSST